MMSNIANSLTMVCGVVSGCFLFSPTLFSAIRCDDVGFIAMAYYSTAWAITRTGSFKIGYEDLVAYAEETSK